MFKYVIEGEPRAWRRPGGTIIRYDTQKEEKRIIAIEVSRQHNDRPLFTKAISFDLVAYIKHPKCSPEKELEMQGTYVTKRPDLDNFLKLLMDACANNVLYKDDSIVAEFSACKIYDPNPRTEITIEVLNEKRK